MCVRSTALRLPGSHKVYENQIKLSQANPNHNPKVLHVHLTVCPFEVFVDVRARHPVWFELSVQFLVREIMFYLLLLLLLVMPLSARRQSRVRVSYTGRVRGEEQIVEKLDVARVVAVANGGICFPRLVEGGVVLQTVEVPQPDSA